MRLRLAPSEGVESRGRRLPLGHYVFTQVVVLAALVGLTLSITGLCGGRLVYTLDDAYIHLSMSEQIADGEYGVNASEPAAASSSALYPFLLSPAARTTWHEGLPLLLNGAALLLTVHVLWRFLLLLGLGASRKGRAFATILVLLLLPGLNLVGLVFTGMEHSLHVLTTVAVIYGLAWFLQTDEVSWFLALGMLLGPLVRYEAVPTSLAAGMVLAWRGVLWRGLGLVLGSLALLVGFSALLVDRGLPPIPSSVLLKSSAAAQGLEQSILGTVSALAANLKRSLLLIRPGILLTGFCVAAFLRLLLPRGRRQGLFILFSLAVVGAHVVAGRYDWWHRYEIYAVASATLGTLWVWRRHLVGAVERHSVVAMSVGAAAALTFVGLDYMVALKDVPVAANNIYEQHYQMYRFATEFYDDDVAVNDIGRVTYRNPRYVLDLWGLASERTRNARADGLTPAELDALLAARGIGLAMIYSDWFEGAVPDTWVLLARLQLSRKKLTPHASHVEFYAADPERADGILEQLRQFSKTLPDGVRLEILP